MADWAQVCPDLDLAPLGVVTRLGRAAAFLDAGVNARLADFGLTRESWDVLASLRRGEPPFQLSPTSLYLGLMRRSGAMTHRLAQLESVRLIRRVPDPDDRRGLLVELTPRGLTLVDEVVAEHLANERRLLSPLSEREQASKASASLAWGCCCWWCSSDGSERSNSQRCRCACSAT